MAREQLGEDGEDRARLWSGRGGQYWGQREDDGKSTGMKKREDVAGQNSNRGIDFLLHLATFMVSMACIFPP